MKVVELMTRDVVTATPEMSLRKAASLLSSRKISGVPVVDPSGAVVGILSEADILAKVSGKRPRGGLLGWLLEADVTLDEKIRARTVGDAMTAPVITTAPNQPVHEAAARMVAESVNRLPVVEDGKLVGIVTRADLVRAFTRTDEEIASEIETEILRRTLWLEPGAVTVTVTDGAVRLEGEVETETDAELLPVFVARVPGVVAVDASLTSRTQASLAR